MHTAIDLEKSPKNNEEKINFLLIYKKELPVVI